MTIEEVAIFLVQHPDWSPSFAQNTRGKVYVDGFYNSGHRYVSMEMIHLMMTANHTGDDTA